MAKGEEKRRRRALAAAEARHRRAAAEERVVIDGALADALSEAAAHIDAVDPEPIADDGHQSEILSGDPLADLTWVFTPRGYLFRYFFERGPGRFLLSWSVLHAAGEGSELRVTFEPELLERKPTRLE